MSTPPRRVPGLDSMAVRVLRRVFGSRSGEATKEPVPTIDSPKIGTLVGGRYRLVREAGRGGIGVVFEARHNQLGQRVAVKFLLDGAATSEPAAQRFYREAHFTGITQHPNIVEVHDVGATPSKQPFLVMEYLDGCTLEDLVTRDGMLSWERAKVLIFQMFDALAHAHAQGVIHRDLKPSNIMVLSPPHREEYCKVIDFGLGRYLHDPTNNSERGASPRHLSETPTMDATITRSDQRLGSPRYISPEQALGRAIDERTDLYALALVIYFMLTGRHAHDTDARQGGGLAAILERQVSRPDHVTVRLDPVFEILQRAAAPNPKLRPSTAREFARLLRVELAALEKPAPRFRTRIPEQAKLVAIALATSILVFFETPSSDHLQQPGDGGVNLRDAFLAAPALNVPGLSTPRSQAPSRRSDYSAALWMQFIDGGFGDDRGVAVTVDRSGSVLVLGTSYNGRNDDVWVRKYGPDRSLIWTQILDSGQKDSAHDFVVNAEGGVFVLSATGQKHWLQHLDAEGDSHWRVEVGEGSRSAGARIAIDPNGELVIVNAISSVALSESASGAGVTVSRWSPQGKLRWRYHSRPVDRPRMAEGVSIDGRGMITVLACDDLWFCRHRTLLTLTPNGDLVGTRELGPFSIHHRAELGVNRDGERLVAGRLNSDTPERTTLLHIDAEGAIQRRSTISTHPRMGPMIAPSPSGAWLLFDQVSHADDRATRLRSYLSDGDLKWIQLVPDDIDTPAYSGIHVDGQGHVFAVGSYRSPRNRNILVLEFDSNRSSKSVVGNVQNSRNVPLWTLGDCERERWSACASTAIDRWNRHPRDAYLQAAELACKNDFAQCERLSELGRTSIQPQRQVAHLSIPTQLETQVAARVWRFACRMGHAKSCTAMHFLLKSKLSRMKQPDELQTSLQHGCDHGDPLACRLRLQNDHGHNEAHRCPAAMSWIEGGAFADLRTGRWHRIDGFCLDKNEIRVDAYRECMQERACLERRAEYQSIPRAPHFVCNDSVADRTAHPMNCINWNDANKYCRWRGMRLPTEWEWEWAARGRDEARRYPWGQATATCERAIMQMVDQDSTTKGRGCHRDRTWPVGSRPSGISRDGIFDLAGNVWEWTSSQIHIEGRGTFHTSRGGGWMSELPLTVSVAGRIQDRPSTRDFDRGARCATSVLNQPSRR